MSETEQSKSMVLQSAAIAEIQQAHEERLRLEDRALDLKASLREAEAERDRLAARLAESWTREVVLGTALEDAKQEIHRMATDGGGFSCSVMDEIDTALGEGRHPNDRTANRAGIGG